MIAKVIRIRYIRVISVSHDKTVSVAITQVHGCSKKTNEFRRTFTRAGIILSQSALFRHEQLFAICYSNAITQSLCNIGNIHIA